MVGKMGFFLSMGFDLFTLFNLFIFILRSTLAVLTLAVLTLAVL